MLKFRRFVYIFFLISLRHFVYGCEVDVPLLPALESRASGTESDYWDGGDDIVVNDADLESKWYRVVLNDWQYIMTDVTKKPDYFKCSTYWPIYLKEKHVSLSNLVENPKDIVACIRDDDSPCSTDYTIQVRKCFDEIQYKLEPTAWLSGYCFDKLELLNRTAKQPAPENVEFGTITVEPDIEFKEENVSGKLLNVPYLKFYCHFNKTDLFYTIIWYVNDFPVYTTKTSKNSTDLVLHEKNLTSKNISMGIYIRCGVKASTDEDGLRTPEKSSKNFYAGIKLAETHIFLRKNSTAVVRMKTSVPIGCTIKSNVKSRFLCKNQMKLFVEKSDRLQCKRGFLANKVLDIDKNQKCASTIQLQAEGDKFDPAVQYNFTIVTADINYEDQDKYILQLQFGSPFGHKIWENYYFPKIKVFVQNTTLYQSKICKARSDPHMITADGYDYDHHREGTFMMYNNTEYNIEVQLKIKECSPSSNGKCTCGIAISAGQDVFMINQCESPRFLGFTQCGDGGILDVNRTHHYLYNVFTPIGTKISIQLRYRSKWMNVEITMAPKDMGNVYGLCGRVDGNRSNDLTHSNRDVVSSTKPGKYNQHIMFSESWRIDEHGEENLFRPTFRTLQPWTKQHGLYCVCDYDKEHRNKALCAPTQYLDCEMSGSITKKKCHVNGRRKRRAGNSSNKEIQRILSKMNVRISSRKKREYDPEIVISEESRSICKRKISGIPALTEFMNVGSTDNEETALKHCEFDLSVTNDTSWADVIVEAVNNGVKSMLDLQPTIVENESEKIETFFLHTCPMNCNNQGECVKPGVCSCNKFYKGSDCSIDERDGLTIEDIEGGGECDLADGEECECFYIRSENIQENFTCSVNTSKISIHGGVEFISSNALTGGFEDIFTGICCAPKSITGQIDVFVAQYTVSISNNGIHFGNAENLYVFHSKCQNVSTNDNGTKSFTLKENHCFIDGYCFSNNEMAPAGCRSCQSSKELYSWIDFNPCQNGGSCVDEDVGYICNCMPGYEGFNCQNEINECLSNPCQNGGNCTDLLNRYSCECTDGFKGENCHIDIDECSSYPCQNNALCVDGINMYQCNCTAGYRGMHCEEDINECYSDPCKNGGTCKDFVAYYSCECVLGYEGTTCSIEINECDSNPCINNGTCNDAVNGFKCICADGFTGENCGVDIDECTSEPCQNGATCTAGYNNYTCGCAAGYYGQNCEIDINECQSNPCNNGGTCEDLVNGFECICVPGYDGALCENDIDECLSSPCQNGNCKDKVNEYECSCVDGFYGTKCNIDINECQSSPCKNGGTCYDYVNGYECGCVPGYDGLLCENDIDECLSSPCQNNGTCTDMVNEYECSCVAGFDGTLCDNDIDECLSSPCQNDGNCTDKINGYECACVAGFNGTNCDNDINECKSNPCINGGTCKDLVNSYECTCVPGYDGALCENDVDECSSNPCLNGGNCTDKINKYECLCVAGFDGSNCDNDINECQSSPCMNGGKCKDLVNGFECACVPGYNGAFCENDIDECASNPCQNDGNCTDKINTYECSCVAGFDGTNCDNDVINDYECTCVLGYNGTFCENDIDECSSNPCQNDGTCTDMVNDYKCSCFTGFTGTYCENDIDECSSNPCHNGNCTNKINEYECLCDAGFGGTNCENDINECLSNPCKNGGTCKDLVNDLECNCVPGYDGALCENDVNECVKYPCENNGTCHDKLNGRICHCVDGYEGIDCETNINDCETNPCLNEGSCEDLVNGYNCTCMTGYEGANCEIVLTSTVGSFVSKLVRTPVTMVLQVKSNLIVTDPILKEDVTYQLTKFYKNSMGDKLKEVVVLSLSLGSLIVDFEVIYVDETSAVVDLTNANLDLVSGDKTIQVFNETVQTASVTIGDVTVSNATLEDKENICAFYTTLNGECEGRSSCSVLSGRPACVSDSTENTEDLTVMIGVCSAVVAIIILAIIHIGLYIKFRGKKLRNCRGKYNIGNEGKGQRKTSIEFGVNERSVIGGSFKPISNLQVYSSPSGPSEETELK